MERIISSLTILYIVLGFLFAIAPLFKSTKPIKKKSNKKELWHMRLSDKAIAKLNQLE